MNYDQTLDYLYSLLPAYHRIGKAAYKDNLDNTLALDAYFGHPHNNYKTIHIAGTNGKGSVAHMLASVLQEAGLRTGLYTSPHLRDFRERIRVNGEMIPEDEVIGFVEKHRDIINKTSPSFFELTVAMAFYYFDQANVDIAVIETGLGGRLDSTNIIIPVLSVITNVGHDHMDLLGDTLEKVASEKAGIIKKNIPVIIGESQKETDHIFRQKAEEKGSPVFCANKYYECTFTDKEMNGKLREFRIKNMKEGTVFKGVTPLGGDYQCSNIGTLFMICDHLKGVYNFDTDIILRGISGVVKNTGLKGRWQILGNKPLIICDTGHNMEGFQYTMKQLVKLPAERIHIVIGFVADKDLSMILPLFPKKASYYFTRASVPRALDEKILKSIAADYGLLGNSFDNVAEALDSAVVNAGGKDVIFIGGSTFVVADIT
jgi:dihydrofolate synthase/folylpolyglutamate synthase